MTREEAIEILEANRPDPCYQMLREAVDFAVDALKAQIDKDINVPNTDCIYRQAAIRTLEDGKYSTDYCKEHGIDHSINMEMVRILLNDLPSAQPTEASCWGCNCPRMERSKEQKTFSEMVHLHDAERITDE